ncbi:hypothetical protein FVEG_16109 [Fusarium verticillioides 7600]|uniref:Uncharacterized protein n=1 Tax=Gibberella moniliformis (strain M3125 / FGSC 7600) TaxID=334819 RepID=W7MIB9_GIBM7|nr:hypothetical protein FVEG_16109 [Fusarium verticillioides 7600]EWG47320.1 hypothetical protein FVEG_16109 [Fusarium verticillioides 7600]
MEGKAPRGCALYQTSKFLGPAFSVVSRSGFQVLKRQSWIIDDIHHVSPRDVLYLPICAYCKLDPSGTNSTARSIPIPFGDPAIGDVMTPRTRLVINDLPNSREHPACTRVGQMPQGPVPGKIIVCHVLNSFASSRAVNAGLNYRT